MSHLSTGSSDWTSAMVFYQSIWNKISPRSLLSTNCSGRLPGSKPISRIPSVQILSKSLPNITVRFQRTFVSQVRNCAQSASTSSMETFCCFGLRWNVSMTSGLKPLSYSRFLFSTPKRTVKRSTWRSTRAIFSQPASWEVSYLESQLVRLCLREGQHRQSKWWKASVWRRRRWLAISSQTTFLNATTSWTQMLANCT